MIFGAKTSNALRERRIVFWLAIICSVMAVVIWIAMASLAADWLQNIDNKIHDKMVWLEWMPLVVLATFLSVVGGVWVTVPLRILILVVLCAKRDVPRLVLWLAAVIPSQLITSVSKLLYSRTRPDDRLLESLSSSFPSGHASNAAVMSLALVFLFVPPGNQRKLWLTLAVIYAVMMAWSRVYLRVHWASDVTAGLLLGASCALWSVWLTRRVWPQRLSNSQLDHESSAGE